MWHKSSSTLSLSTFKDLPEAVQWAFGVKRWKEGWQDLLAIPQQLPVQTILAVILVIGLQLKRSRIKKSLKDSAQEIHQISTDRYIYTIKAFLNTLLLALPAPILLAYLSWSIVQVPNAGEWVRGLGIGLGWISVLLGWCLFFREVCRPSGLGIVHFGWQKKVANLMRQALLTILIIYIPALLIISVTFYDESAQRFDSLGRMCFIISTLWLAGVIFRLFCPKSGFITQIRQDSLTEWATARQIAWVVFLGLPLLGLIASAVMGYFLSAIALNWIYIEILFLMALGVFVYNMALRWFMVKERKMALKEAMEKRLARREAVKCSSEPAPSSGETINIDDDSLELDLNSIGQQTRRLLRSLVSMGVIVGIWLLLVDSLPMTSILDRPSFNWILQILQWIQIAMVVTIATITVKNLPGFLDLAGFRNTSLDPGTRYAVSTIFQYVISAIAIFTILRISKVDWSQFGWIATALSVGLGFGLQEIVANFVCGIILLFERPVRVGDVVTVGEVTGTITNIKMRATTITNWDRQEFLVPNKEFVTGSIINWTLTTEINRIIIPVGVAYGSNTDQALSLLKNIANSHPRVLDDPAPIAVFEEFANSTLNLSLRCYLPDMENRIITISELHSEVDRQFKKANIEIAFPQCDVHLHSKPSELSSDKLEPAP